MPYVCLCMCVCLKSFGTCKALGKSTDDLLPVGISEGGLNPSPFILPRGEKGAEREERERENVKQRNLDALILPFLFCIQRGCFCLSLLSLT